MIVDLRSDTVTKPTPGMLDAMMQHQRPPAILLIHHCLVKCVLRFQYLGRIGIDDQKVLAIEDAHDAVPGSLCLGGEDGQVLPD